MAFFVEEEVLLSHHIGILAYVVDDFMEYFYGAIDCILCSTPFVQIL